MLYIKHINKQSFLFIMNQKQIGIIVIIMGIVLCFFTYAAKIREDKNIDLLIQAQGGSCYLLDGTCLHEDRDYTIYIIGAAISFSLLVFGIYLTFFDKTQDKLAEHQKVISKELNLAKKHEKDIKEFEAFLSGFNPEEQTVIKAIKENEGIKQSTLRYKTGMSKTGLSLLLKSLEKKEIISKKEDGKTNQIFLRQKF